MCLHLQYLLASSEETNRRMLVAFPWKTFISSTKIFLYVYLPEELSKSDNMNNILPPRPPYNVNNVNRPYNVHGSTKYGSINKYREVPNNKDAYRFGALGVKDNFVALTDHFSLPTWKASVCPCPSRGPRRRKLQKDYHNNMVNIKNSRRNSIEEIHWSGLPATSFFFRGSSPCQS